MDQFRFRLARYWIWATQARHGTQEVHRAHLVARETGLVGQMKVWQDIVLEVGQPLTDEGFDFVCSVMEQLEAIREVIGGDGHDNMAERVSWAIRQARGERAH
jgi:hypothetical protein